MFSRGDVFYVDMGKPGELGGIRGSEQGGIRPCVIIQNDTGNRHSQTVIVSPITTVIKKTEMPTHLLVKCQKPSMVLCEQIKTISKDRIKEKVGHLTDEELENLDRALAVSIGLKNLGGKEIMPEIRLNTEVDFVAKHISKIKEVSEQLGFIRLCKEDFENAKEVLRKTFATLTAETQDKMIKLAQDELNQQEEDCLGKLAALCSQQKESTKQVDKKELTKEEAVELYIVQNRTAREIAEMYDMKTQSVNAFMFRNGIKKSPSKAKGITPTGDSEK